VTIKQDKTPERQELEMLLPWHAAGTLGRMDSERVDAALARDQELRHQYGLVQEELAETVHLNEALAAPLAGAMERLMASLQTEAPARAGRWTPSGAASWVAAQIARLSPQALALSAAAALVLILLEAGVLAGLYLQTGRPGSYQTASVPQPVEAGGSYALVGFTPEASAAEVTKLLESHGLSVVDGPRAGGLFRIRVGAAGMPKAELSGILARLQRESRIVRFAAEAE
jgi:hypothetical protein